MSGGELVYEDAMKAIGKMPDSPQKTAAIENAERGLAAAQFEEKHGVSGAAGYGGSADLGVTHGWSDR